MKRAENQVSWSEYLAALWNRRWLVVAATAGLMIVVALISLFTPPVWRVEMIVQPAKSLAQNQAGQFIDILQSDTRQIVTAVGQRSYDAAIAADLKVDVRDLPPLQAEFLRDSRLVRVSANAKNPELAVLALRALFSRLKTSLDKKVIIEINALGAEIKKNELQSGLLAEEVATLENRLKIIDQREREILAEKKAGGERLAAIQKDPGAAAQAAGRDALSQALLSYIIQQGHEHIAALDELLSEKRTARETIAQRRREAEEAREVLKITNLSLEERKGKYDFTEIVKEPTSSGTPVSPRTARNVLLAGILGVLVSGLAALTWESLDKGKARG